MYLLYMDSYLYCPLVLWQYPCHFSIHLCMQIILSFSYFQCFVF